MTDIDTVLDTLYGALEVPDWPNDLIVRSLRELGEWCAAETALAAELLDPGETLWDAGAYLGTFALGVSEKIALGCVVAIEANPATAIALSNNLSLLSCPVRMVSAGLAARAGWLVPLSDDAFNHGATAWEYRDAVPRDDAEAPQPVTCRTLADLRQEFGDYNMLKLDLEGMELDALSGDFPFLRARHPLLWAECNESADSLRLLSALKWLNYDVLYVAFPAFRSANFNASTDLIYPMAYEAALVAGPAERLQRLTAGAASLVPGEEIICRKIDTAYDLRRALYDTPRWAKVEWISLSRAELIARLVRCGDGVRLNEFMVGMEAAQD